MHPEVNLLPSQAPSVRKLVGRAGSSTAQAARAGRAARPQFSGPPPMVAETEPVPFKCPNCGALYRIVRVEAAAANDREIRCAVCGAPLPGRDGQFILKYFLFASFGPWSSRQICRYVTRPGQIVSPRCHVGSSKCQYSLDVATPNALPHLLSPGLDQAGASFFRRLAYARFDNAVIPGRVASLRHYRDIRH